MGMQVVAGSISNQSRLVWYNATATDPTLTTLTSATVTVGEGVALRVYPRDQYLNPIDGGWRRDILMIRPYVETSMDTSSVTFDVSERIYKGAVSQVFPEGSYGVYVDILAKSSQNKIHLGPLMIQAVGLPCNASRHLTPSTLSATCVCMV